MCNSNSMTVFSKIGALIPISSSSTAKMLTFHVLHKKLFKVPKILLRYTLWEFLKE